MIAMALRWFSRDRRHSTPEERATFAARQAAEAIARRREAAACREERLAIQSQLEYLDRQAASWARRELTRV